MEELKVGDVVQLKSGGPPMTIADIRPYSDTISDGAYCEWFYEDREKKSAIFNKQSLIKWEEKPAGSFDPVSGS